MRHEKEVAPMGDETIATLTVRIRERMAGLLASGAGTRDTALLLAELEEEQARRDEIDKRLAARADGLVVRQTHKPIVGSVLDRALPVGLDRRAGTPRTLRSPNAEELLRGVAIAYSNANLTFYRAVIERLLPGEKFRLETQHGTFEMTRDEFEGAVPAMVRTPSYQRGTAGAPGAARYVTGRVPRSIERFRVDGTDRDGGAPL
jgi:hypothetical protein